MARKGSAPINPTKPMDEETAKGEKDSIAAAFDAAPVVTGPTSTPVSTKHDPTHPPAEAGKIVPIESSEPLFVEAVDPSEMLPTFQKVFYTPMTEHDLATKAKQAGALTKSRDELEIEKDKAVADFNKRIKGFQAGIDSLMKEINAEGHEQEIECRKRVNYDTGEATIFDANTLRVLEVRKLNEKELQVEMGWAGKLPPGRNGDTIGGAGKTIPFKPRSEESTPPAEDGKEETAPPAGDFEDSPNELGKQAGRGKKGKGK